MKFSIPAGLVFSQLQVYSSLFCAGIERIDTVKVIKLVAVPTAPHTKKEYSKWPIINFPHSLKP